MSEPPAAEGRDARARWRRILGAALAVAAGGVVIGWLLRPPSASNPGSGLPGTDGAVASLSPRASSAEATPRSADVPPRTSSRRDGDPDRPAASRTGDPPPGASTAAVVVPGLVDLCGIGPVPATALTSATLDLQLAHRAEIEARLQALARSDDPRRRIAALRLGAEPAPVDLSRLQAEGLAAERAVQAACGPAGGSAPLAAPAGGAVSQAPTPACRSASGAWADVRSRWQALAVEPRVRAAGLIGARSSDPVVVANAWAVCREADAPVPGCDTATLLRRWSQLEPDNGAPALLELERAAGVADASAVTTALAWLAAARRLDAHGGLARSTMLDDVLRPGDPPALRTAVLLTVAGAAPLADAWWGPAVTAWQRGCDRADAAAGFDSEACRRAAVALETLDPDGGLGDVGRSMRRSLGPPDAALDARVRDDEALFRSWAVLRPGLDPTGLDTDRLRRFGGDPATRPPPLDCAAMDRLDRLLRLPGTDDAARWRRYVEAERLDLAPFREAARRAAAARGAASTPPR